MALTDFLIQHARANVWCTPNQDSQYVFKPHRISKPRGVIRAINIMQDSYNLPTLTDRYHVYQIGQLPATFLGLVDEVGVWRTVANACRTKNLVVDLYMNNGVQLPRFQSWVIVTADKNVLLAIQDQPRIVPSLVTEDIYMRLYANAFFQSARSTETLTLRDDPTYHFAINHFVYVWGRVIADNNDVSILANIFATRFGSQCGYCYATVNGYMVNTLNSANMAVGDVVEIVHDTTVEWVVDLALTDLATFTSTLDSKQKYLLTYENAILATERPTRSAIRKMDSTQIYYLDDNDIFLYKVVSNGLEKGVLYHKNQPDAVRMVTHRDFSLPVSYVTSYIDNAGLFTDPSQVRIRMFMRMSGYKRDLIDESSRISELYRFFDDSRAPIRALHAGLETAKDMMTGIQSNLAFWKAAALETAAYPRLMRSYEQFITPAMVLDAYGYHTSAKILADTWQPITSTSLGNPAVTHKVAIPIGLQQGTRTVVIYSTPTGDAQRYSAVRTSQHLVQADGGAEFILPPEAFVTGYVPIMAEVFSGWGMPSLLQYDAAPVVSVDDEYRCYKCPIGIHGPTYEWVDVTGTNAYTTETFPNPVSIDGVIQDRPYTTITWALDPLFWYTSVKSARHYLDYEIQIASNVGMLRFSIDSETQVWDAVNETYTPTLDIMRIPPAKLELSINGKHLYETLDYTVKWPEVVIHTKAAYTNMKVIGGINYVVINVRAHGFCNNSLQRDPLPEMGFVRNGVISGDSRFDIRDSRVKRLYYDGKLIDVNKLKSLTGVPKVSENRGTEYIFAPSLSGKPYAFEDTVVPLPFLPSTHNANTMRQADLAKDRAISDFYSDKYPEIPPTTPDYAAQLYALFSPFYFKVLHDVITGIIPTEVYSPPPTDTALRAALVEYEFLLPYDPVLKDDIWWKGDVVVHGHPLPMVSVNSVQWAFMVRVDQLYLRGALNTNANIAIV